jgi:hypothetical protein
LKQADINRPNKRGRTPLHEAIRGNQEGAFDVVLGFVVEGCPLADVNAVDDQVISVFHLSVLSAWTISHVFSLPCHGNSNGLLFTWLHSWAPTTWSSGCSAVAAIHMRAHTTEKLHRTLQPVLVSSRRPCSLASRNLVPIRV